MTGNSESTLYAGRAVQSPAPVTEPHHTREYWCHFGDVSININWTTRAPCKSHQSAAVAYTVSAVQDAGDKKKETTQSPFSQPASANSGRLINLFPSWPTKF